MKLEIAISTIIGFIIIDVMIWYGLSIKGIANATEISIFLAIIFISLLFIIGIHGRGMMELDEIRDKRTYREGISYSRIKKLTKPYRREKKITFQQIKISFIGKKIKYSRKKYR